MDIGLRTIFTIIFLGLLVFAGWQYVRTKNLIIIGETLAITAEGRIYEQTPRNASSTILHIGDSTVVGTGASSSETTITALIGAHYPRADVINNSKNGRKTAAVREELEKYQADGTEFDLIVIHTGGNDIVRFTDLDSLRADYAAVLDIATNISKHTVILCCGDFASVGLLPLGSHWLFSWRTKQVHEIFRQEIELAKQETDNTLTYVNLLRSADNDPFQQNPKAMYAADEFHPSDAGYADWFSLIEPALPEM